MSNLFEETPPTCLTVLTYIFDFTCMHSSAVIFVNVIIIIILIIIII